MIYLILAFVLIVVICVIAYFFCMAFLKLDTGNLDDMNNPANKPLSEHHEVIAKGIEYINSIEFEWVETVSFDGLKLMARYFNNNSDKTIFLFHGYRSSASRDFSCAVNMYLDFGFNILLIDQRSHGKSEGKLITFGVKESRDVVSWLEFVNKSFNPKKIIISGMSMGATTVLLSLNYKLPNNVVGVIADSGFTSPVDIIKLVAKKSMKINAGFFIPILNACCLLLGGFSLYKSNTIKSAKKSDLPILLIHGKADNFVPPEMSQSVFDERKENTEIFLVENAGHGLGFLVDTKGAMEKLEAFIKKCIQ